MASGRSCRTTRTTSRRRTTRSRRCTSSPARRLARARLTVVDATNVQPEARKPLVALAREYHVLPVAIVLDLPERICHERNRSRPDRDFGPHVIRNQRSQLHRSLRGLGREGFRHVHVLKSQEEVDAAVIERQPLWNNRKRETGPFDIIGDVHGCCDELEELLQQLGYAEERRRPVGTPGRPKGDLRRRSRGPRPAHRRHAQDGDVDVAGRNRVECSWQPRHQVEAEARGPRRHRLSRTRSLAARARTGDLRVPSRGRRSSWMASSATTSSTTVGSLWRMPV